MTRSKLQNKYDKNRTQRTWITFKNKQRNALKIPQNGKTEYFSNLTIKDVMDNKKLWSTVKPFFSDKS